MKNMQMFPIPVGRVGEHVMSVAGLREVRGPNGPCIARGSTTSTNYPGQNSGNYGDTPIFYVGYYTVPFKRNVRWPSVSASERQVLRSEAKAPSAAPYYA